MGRVMGTLMSDQIFASVAYSGLVTYPHFSISFLTIVPCSGIGNHIGFGWLSFLLQALWIPERIPNSIQLTVFPCCFYDVYEVVKRIKCGLVIRKWKGKYSHDVPDLKPTYVASKKQELVAELNNHTKEMTVLAPSTWDPSIRLDPPKNIPSATKRKEDRQQNSKLDIFSQTPGFLSLLNYPQKNMERNFQLIT